MSEKNNNTFESTVSSLFQGMDHFISSKTVVGDAITVGDTIILPLVDVSFGVGAGAAASEGKNNGAGGLGGKCNRQEHSGLFRWLPVPERVQDCRNQRAELL